MTRNTTNSLSEILSVHPFRRSARKRERELDEVLTGIYKTAGHPADIPVDLVHRGLPPWTRGVRVRKAGAFSWVVEATEWRGH